MGDGYIKYIHHTWYHFQHYFPFFSPGTEKADISNKRGVSLFKEIPETRSCSQAGITTHWCACLSWQPLSTSHAEVRQATATAIDKINSIIDAANKSQICHKLSLDKITHAAFYKPSAQERRTELLMKKYAQMKPYESSEPTESDSDSELPHEIHLYQVSFIARPSGGHFEVTCVHDVTDGKFKVFEKDISRINKYGNDPDCVASSKPHLRPYCYCPKELS